jgi:hypothetical protein
VTAVRKYTNRIILIAGLRALAILAILLFTIAFSIELVFMLIRWTYY